MLAAVSHGNGDVPQQPLAAGPLHWRALEPSLELCRIHSGEPVQRRVHYLRAGKHALVGRDWGFAIPGAHVLADVAPEDLAAHWLAQLLGDHALLLDGE